MVGIIDYGVGNLFSLRSSFKAIGEEAFVSGDPTELSKADRLVLPGVGAFEDAAKKLRQSGMDTFVRTQAAEGKPLLGICLGMQMLFEKSFDEGLYKNPWVWYGIMAILLIVTLLFGAYGHGYDATQFIYNQF